MSICKYYDMSSSSCVGAKYGPECSCKGDTTVCDFYPDTRTSDSKDASVNKDPRTKYKLQHNPGELTLIHQVAILLPNDPTVHYFYVVETLMDDRDIFNYLRLNTLSDAVKNLYDTDKYTIVSDKIFPLAPVILVDDVSK